MSLTFEVIMADASGMEQSKALELIAKLEDSGSGMLSLLCYLETPYLRDGQTRSRRILCPFFAFRARRNFQVCKATFL